MKIEADNILRSLIRRYERSVLSKQGSERHLRIRFDMEKEMNAYYHYEYLEEAAVLDEEMERLEAKQWVSVKRNDGRITEVELNPDTVEEVYAWLKLDSAAVFHQDLSALLEQYRGQGIDNYIDDVEDRIKSYKSVKQLVFEDLKLQENLLKSLAAMQTLEKDTLERVFSAEVLHYSKAFEPIRAKAVRLLRLYFSEEPEAEDEELLAQFHILKNPGHLILKGHGMIQVKDTVLRMENFAEGMTLSSSDVNNVTTMDLADPDVLTIENLTAFYQCERKNTLIIYLGGYHNTVRRQFLKRIFEMYPEKHYYHFGDIDAGGFYILEHLKRMTGIPFEPFLMGVSELERYHERTIPLTESDRKRLLALAERPEYTDVIQTMLETNRKMEQEQIPASDMIR